MIGGSVEMRAVHRWIERLASSDVRVLITGESGTGKELAARSIHGRSSRWQRPFVAVNCGAVPVELVSSELFGTERGAFTGATSRPGRFEQADGGTLFLDEIGELPATAQASLLRVLDAGSFQRLGGTRAMAVDVRLLSATNVDLAEAAERRAFRADLLYRVRQVELKMPPLRHRGGDIAVLISYLLPKLAAALGRVDVSLSAEANERLLKHSWPGNVRELEHALLHALAHSESAVIEVDSLPTSVTEPGGLSGGSGSLPQTGSLAAARSALTAAAEAEWIRSQVECHPTLAGASGALQINPRTLYEKMQRYGIRHRGRD
jgi:DNA-binding NtrC family response regulator